MTCKFVRLSSELRATFSGPLSSQLPIYRLYVNDELMSERSWRWTDCYLVEELQISAEPGTYTLRYELVDRGDVKDFALNVGALTATVGDVAVVNKEQFVIKL